MNDITRDQPETLAEFEDLLERALILKKSLRMVTKITNSEKLLNLGKSLKEILPALPGTITDLRTLALESEGEDRKRYAHLGVQLLQLKEYFMERQPQVAKNLKKLSKAEEEFLGQASRDDGDPGNDQPDTEGEDDSTESTDPEQQEG